MQTCHVIISRIISLFSKDFVDENSAKIYRRKSYTFTDNVFSKMPKMGLCLSSLGLNPDLRLKRSGNRVHPTQPKSKKLMG